MKKVINVGVIKGIIFDLGGTLIFFDGTWDEVIPRAIEEMYKDLSEAGLELERQRFLSEFYSRMEKYYIERETDCVELTTVYILKTLLQEWGYKNITQNVLQSAVNALHSVTQTHWHPEEDSIPTLQALKEIGYRLAMISNAGDDLDVQSLVDKAAVRPFFDIIITSAAQGIRKPHPEIFKIVLDYWDFKPSEVVMVGDNLRADIVGANQSGILSAWINRRVNVLDLQEQLEQIQPSATISALSKLPALLDKLP